MRWIPRPWSVYGAGVGLALLVMTRGCCCRCWCTGTARGCGPRGGSSSCVSAMWRFGCCARATVRITRRSPDSGATRGRCLVICSRKCWWLPRGLGWPGSARWRSMERKSGRMRRSMRIRGREWFDRHAAEAIADAEKVDHTEDAAARAAGGEQRPDRLPPELGERTSRRDRIRQAARELRAQHQRASRASEEREAGALGRLERSRQGQPVAGRIPDGPHRLPEARAHLAREIAIHQAKLERYRALIAAGKKPMGRPPVPMGGVHPRPAGAKGSGQRAGGRPTIGQDRPERRAGNAATEDRGEHDRSAVAHHADQAGIPAGLQRATRGHR